jgi:hypothetical protein
MNGQNSCYWNAENLHGVLFPGIKVRVWCAVSAGRKIRRMLFDEILNSQHYGGSSRAPFLNELRENAQVRFAGQCHDAHCK